MLLYELAGQDRQIRFSPYVWRIKMALAHKGISYESIPVRFLEKEGFAESGSKTVPVLKDEDRWIAESWPIACYLEDNYADRPSLFGCAEGRGLARTFSALIDGGLMRPLFLSICPDIPAILSEEGAAYFRKTREERIGATLEETRRKRPDHLKTLAKSLKPLAWTLKNQPFICGDRPAYGDYALFGLFQWARLVSADEVLPEGSSLFEWRQRMLGLFDGLAGSAKGVADLSR